MTNFEVLNFGGPLPIQYGDNGGYDCAFNYIIRFKRDKIVLLGTNGVNNEYNFGGKKLHTEFGLYYKKLVISTALTALSFNPSTGMTLSRPTVTSPDDISITSIIEMIPASPSPAPVLIWSIEIDSGATSNSFDD